MSEQDWREADAELDRMAEALAEMGNAIIDLDDDFARDVEACIALAELTLPIWQRHPKALEGFVSKLVTHEQPGGRALALAGAVFMPGKLGEFLNQARFTLLMLGKRANLPEWTHRAAMRAVPTRFFLTYEANEDHSPGLYCLFEREGKEFGWFIGFDPGNCGIAIDFQHVPTVLCQDLTEKVLDGPASGGLHAVDELTEPEGRWLAESSLTALETHDFKFAEEVEAAPEAPMMRDRIAFTALLRWHLHGGERKLARPLPKHGTHLPFERWD